MYHCLHLPLPGLLKESLNKGRRERTGKFGFIDEGAWQTLQDNTIII